MLFAKIDKIEATSHDNLDVRFLHEQSRVRVKLAGLPSYFHGKKLGLRRNCISSHWHTQMPR